MPTYVRRIHEKSYVRFRALDLLKAKAAFMKQNYFRRRENQTKITPKVKKCPARALREETSFDHNVVHLLKTKHVHSKQHTNMSHVHMSLYVVHLLTQ